MGVLTSHIVRDRFVELELNSSQPVGDISVVETLDEDFPRVCMSIGNARWSWITVGEGHRGAANDEWAADLCQLDALSELIWRSHIDVARAGCAGGVNDSVK
jgi:hypothetical protein